MDQLEKLLIEIPGAVFTRGTHSAANHYAVKLGKDVVGSYYLNPEDAVKSAKEFLAAEARHAKELSYRAERIKSLRDKLFKNEDIADGDLKLLNLHSDKSGLKWFIPAAAELFDIPSRAIRPHIKELIRIGLTDMGVKKEFVPTKKALQKISFALSNLNKLKE